MRALAILPARGGSKRIPRKNIRPFAGRPILHHAIDAVRGAGCFDEIMVSTEDDEIAEIARSGGATVPFRRSEAGANDHATTANVIEEVLESYANLGRTFDLVCCIYPTAALATAARIREGGELLAKRGELDAVISVLPFSYPIQRAMKIVDGRAVMISPKYVDARSQDLEPAFRDAGQWYWLRTKAFRKSGRIIGSACGVVVLDEMEAQDIDTEADWKIAELKFRRQREF